MTDRLLWRPNLGSSGGWRLGLPFIPIQMSGEDMKFIGERVERGVIKFRSRLDSSSISPAYLR